MVGVSLTDFDASNTQALLQPQPLGIRTIFAVVAGGTTVFGVVFYTAILGRIFRTIRGID
jgi:hypothetical protein